MIIFLNSERTASGDFPKLLLLDLKISTFESNPQYKLNWENTDGVLFEVFICNLIWRVYTWPEKQTRINNPKK